MRKHGLLGRIDGGKVLSVGGLGESAVDEMSVLLINHHMVGRLGRWIILPAVGELQRCNGFGGFGHGN